jgi:hypothetical protein
MYVIGVFLLDASPVSYVMSLYERIIPSPILSPFPDQFLWIECAEIWK